MNYPPITIVIPTWNEEANIDVLVRRVAQAMNDAGITYEMIFVDDHSTDTTHAKISKHVKTYPISVHKKRGKQGKAESIMEGSKLAKYEFICMLDADLQYPPEVIPALLLIAAEKGVGLANRRTYNNTWTRRAASRLNAKIFGHLLHGLKADVQSGLKILPKRVFDQLNPALAHGWAIDIPLLATAVDLGYSIGHVDIDFTPRANGESKVGILHAAKEIAFSALRTKFHRHRVYATQQPEKNSMRGAEITYHGKRFTTHTTLSHRISALKTLHGWQQVGIGTIFGIVLAGFLLNPLQTAIIVVGILSSIYFIDVFFNLFLILKSLYNPPELSFTQSEISSLRGKPLPLYTIMCPLYKEAHVLPQFITSMKSLDWPKNKLDVMLLLEEDDKETIGVAREMDLPEYIRIVVVPDGQPKTKPKACNYGLSHAKGEYTVIFDAEDQPDPQQLKKAYLGFLKAPANTVCLQAKLNYYNPHDNLLTRLFTAEYSLWFDVMLTGLQTIETSIPLGGTSNHFRTADLQRLQGWDPFNVTEDCDLGIRLFREGYKTAIIDSTTLEEANSDFGNWLRQRSRWIKGYMQTYLVHMRNPFKMAKTQGIHAVFFQLVIGGKIAFMLINPFLWLATIAYFTLYAFVGPTIEALYPSIIFYMAVTSLVFGNFLCLYYYMIGCAKREHWTLIKYIFLVPIYWLMVSIAAGIALYQLIVKPHYWEKTNHGLNLPHEPQKASTRVSAVQKASSIKIEPHNFIRSKIFNGGLLVAATAIGSGLNFLYNAYLGRTVPIETFGVINLFGTFFYLVSIPIGALGKTITYRSAYLFGKYDKPIFSYWKFLQKPLLVVASISTVLWLLAMPIIASLFHIPSIFPLLLFSPIWFVAIGAAANNGFLGGTLQFSFLAILTIVDAAIKLVAAVVMISFGQGDLIYFVIPLAIGVEYILGVYIINKYSHKTTETDPKAISYFPKRFFATSILSTLSGATFLTVDVLLVNHYMSPLDAGHYGLLSLVGKMIIVAGSMFAQFLTPVVSHEIGAGRDGTKQFYNLLAITTAVCLVGFVIVGEFGYITIPFLFGKDVASIVDELPLYTLAMMFFTIASSIVSFHQIRKEYVFPVASFLLAFLLVTGLMLFHNSLSQVVTVIFISALLQLLIIILLHIFHEQVRVFIVNAIDFLGLFGRIPTRNLTQKKLRILIFNWRDTKHVWAGGAEAYIHELSKQWVGMGYAVTVFCGNDGKTPRNQVIDGVQIVRRGGFYTVYFWAFLYYILRFRGLYDVIIDSENGIPFFTPLYAKVPVFLLIHHVHQDVFRERLNIVLATVANFMESTLMPTVYKNSQVITVSESSKQDIVSHKLAKDENVSVINPGITSDAFTKHPKTSHPSLLYLGRLKAYKNIDVALQSFSLVLKKIPKAKFVIAGEGEHQQTLIDLTNKLNLHHAVTFLGKVEESKKAELFATSWIAVQPSSHEGWGISVIEANASGTPVVASAINGLMDSVVNNRTGILVAPKNTQAFANAIEIIMTNATLRARLSNEAYEWSKSFSWERSALDFMDQISNTFQKQNVHVIKNNKNISFAKS